MSRIKLTKFEAAQLLMQNASILTAGAVANPGFRPEQQDQVRNVMQTSVQVAQEFFDILGFEIEP